MTRPPGLPYARLNLRTNPFRTLDAEERAELAVVDAEALEAWVGLLRGRLPEGGRASRSAASGSPPSPAGRPLRCLVLQLLGPGGCGKTTHLEALRRRFPGAPLWAWSTRDGWPPMPRGEPLFVDDAHELAGRAWPRLVCGRRAVVAATRTDLGAVPGHPGTSPGEAGPLVRGGGVELLTVQVADRVTPADIHRMVRRRLEWARRGPGPIPSVADTLVAALVARHGRDLRGLTDELYRHVQEHPGVAS